MNTELTRRRMFSFAQVIIGLVTPFVYVTTLTGLSFSAMRPGQLGYWFVLPAACFFGLSAAALLRRADGFRVSRSGLWGAAIAGYLGMALPAVLIFIALAIYSGGGANIGLALLMYAMPGYLPVAMVIGLVVGEARNVPQKPG